jgi:hypothetical protein
VASREEIARRHGIPDLAPKLVGETAEELEADAAAKARVIRMLSPRDLNEESPEPPEPEVEGVPPSDKPVSEWTEEERAAFHADHERKMRELEKRKAAEHREREERLIAEANKTDDQRLGDTVSGLLQPGVKDAANRALIRELHDLEGDEGDQS